MYLLAVVVQQRICAVLGTGLSVLRMSLMAYHLPNHQLSNNVYMLF